MFSWLFSRKPEPRAITTATLLNLGNYSDSPSVVVTEDTSLQLVTVRSCIDLIARTIATLSVHAYEGVLNLLVALPKFQPDRCHSLTFATSCVIRTIITLRRKQRSIQKL